MCCFHPSENRSLAAREIRRLLDMTMRLIAAHAFDSAFASCNNNSNTQIAPTEAAGKTCKYAAVTVLTRGSRTATATISLASW